MALNDVNPMPSGVKARRDNNGNQIGVQVQVVTTHDSFWRIALREIRTDGKKGDVPTSLVMGVQRELQLEPGILKNYGSLYLYGGMNAVSKLQDRLVREGYAIVATRHPGTTAAGRRS